MRSCSTRDAGAFCPLEEPTVSPPVSWSRSGARSSLRPGSGTARPRHPDRGGRPIGHDPALPALGGLEAGPLEDQPHLRQGLLDDLPGDVLPDRLRRLRPAQLPPPAARGLLVLGDQAGVLPIDGRSVVVLLSPGAVVGVVGELAAPNGDDRVPHEPVLRRGGQLVQRPVGDGQRLQHRVPRGGLRPRQPRLRRVGRETDPLLVGDRHHHRRRRRRRRRWSGGLCRDTGCLHPGPPANAGRWNVVAAVAGAPGPGNRTPHPPPRHAPRNGPPAAAPGPTRRPPRSPPQLRQVPLEDRADGVLPRRLRVTPACAAVLGAARPPGVRRRAGRAPARPRSPGGPPRTGRGPGLRGPVVAPAPRRSCPARTGPRRVVCGRGRNPTLSGFRARVAVQGLRFRRRGPSGPAVATRPGDRRSGRASPS